MNTFPKVFAELKAWAESEVSPESSTDPVNNWLLKTSENSKKFEPFFEYIQERALLALKDIGGPVNFGAMITLCISFDYIFHLGMLTQKKMMESSWNPEDDVNF